MKTLSGLLCFTLLGVLNSECLSQSLTFRDFYRIGMEAYEEHDYAEFLEATRKADSLRPNHPVLLYNLAAGYALSGQKEQALNTLKYRQNFYAAKDFLEDQDFKSLHGTSGWEDLEQLINQSNAPKQSSSLAFEFDFPGFHPEGIAYETATGRFYISDIRNGLIYSFDGKGNDRKPVIDLKEHGYWSAMGLAFDPADPQKLWITTSAMPNFTGYKEELEGRSAVLCFNPETGELLQSWSVEGRHLFGDLTLAENGTVYFTDSLQPVVYAIKPGEDSVHSFVKNENWWNLQGLALAEDETTLYVSDYITGMFRIDITSKEVSTLIDSNELLRGADGVYLINEHLILLQNGTQPKRVASIKLDSKGYGVSESLSFPDQALPDLNEPTLGTIVDGELYYIANSPWPYYDNNNNPDLENWPSPKIFKLIID